MVKTFSDGFVEHCLRCEAITPEDREENDIFCQQCAAPLVNRCTNEYGHSYGNDEQCGIKLDPKAVFCKKCATISLFASKGLIENKYPEVEIVAPRSTSDDIPF